MIGLTLAIVVAGMCVTALVLAVMDAIEGVKDPTLWFGVLVGVLLTLSLLHILTVLA